MLSGSPVALRVAKIDGQSSAHSALPPGGASGTGTVTNPPVTGAGPAEMSPMGASGTGTVTNASARGTLSAVLAPIALRATGTVTIPRVTGSGMSGVPPAGVRGPGSATLRTQGDETILPEDGEAILTESGPGRPRSPAPAGGTGARSAPMSGNADVIRAEGSGARGTVNPALSGRAQFNFDARGTATALSGNEAAGPLASYAKVGAALLSSGGARPESVNDQPTDTDHIGFKPYVDALAQFLMSERTLPPLTVSLEGEWGAGKSSFMAQLDGALNRLAGTKRAVPSAAENNAEIPRIISFNAWRHDKDEAVWASFALEFARGVAPTGLRD
ncbi:MAG: hypothetical protein JWP97_4355 [Labilithrix sp.]|nr:hypothetical protein [Labilithrix sp.]